MIVNFLWHSIGLCSLHWACCVQLNMIASCWRRFRSSGNRRRQWLISADFTMKVLNDSQFSFLPAIILLYSLFCYVSVVDSLFFMLFIGGSVRFSATLPNPCDSAARHFPGLHSPNSAVAIPVGYRGHRFVVLYDLINDWCFFKLTTKFWICDYRRDIFEQQ